MTDTFDEQHEMLDGFIADSHELLEEIEPRLIELQQTFEQGGGADGDTLHAVFRLFHSLKGAAGFLGLKNVTGVTHAAENLLNLIREGTCELTAARTDVLCKACDCLHALLGRIEQSGGDAGAEDECSILIQALEAAAGEKQQPTAESPAAEQQSPAGQEPAAGEEPPADTRQQTVEISPEMVSAFIQESEEYLDNTEQNLVDIEQAQDTKERLSQAFRNIHSFKGNCGFMGFSDPERVSHRIETVLGGVLDGTVGLNEDTAGVLLRALDALRAALEDISGGGTGQIKGCHMMVEILDDMSSPAEADEPRKPRLGEILIARGDATAEAVEEALQAQQKPVGQLLVEKGAASAAAVDKALSRQKQQGGGKLQRNDIRVDLSKLDTLMDLVGELVIAQLMVVNSPDLRDLELEHFTKSSYQLQRVTTDLQDVAMSIRMVPLSATFRKMIRLVHDLSRKFDKKVTLSLAGEETEVDKTVIEQISDPLVHIIRNAVDHGIEPPRERLEGGKEEAGTIRLEARHDGGEVLIIITDDGAGMSRDKILAKAVDRGIVADRDGQKMKDEDVFRLIFEPGFSTADEVTDVSGRGVGMDVVKKNLENLKGSVDAASEPGRGSTFTLHIPLTLAIIEGMVVRAGSNHYIIPLLAIRESLRAQPEHITVMPDGTEVVKVRQELLPVVRMHALYDVTSDTTRIDEGILVLLEHQGESVCLFIDEVMGQQQTVIKPLPDYMRNIRGLSGCSIMGDGQVCLIIDVGGIIEKYRDEYQKLNEEADSAAM